MNHSGEVASLSQLANSSKCRAFSGAIQRVHSRWGREREDEDDDDDVDDDHEHEDLPLRYLTSSFRPDRTREMFDLDEISGPCSLGSFGRRLLE